MVPVKLASQQRVTPAEVVAALMVAVLAILYALNSPSCEECDELADQAKNLNRPFPELVRPAREADAAPRHPAL